MEANVQRMEQRWITCYFRKRAGQHTVDRKHRGYSVPIGIRRFTLFTETLIVFLGNIHSPFNRGCPYDAHCFCVGVTVVSSNISSIAIITITITDKHSNSNDCFLSKRQCIGWKTGNRAFGGHCHFGLFI